MYVRNYHAPDPTLDRVSGYWRWEDDWPIERIENHSWYAHANHSLSIAPAEKATHSMTYKPSIGLEGGGPTMWWGSILPDQQPMDDYSLVYDSEILDTPLEILGRPIARLRVSANATRANWVAVYYTHLTLPTNREV